MPICSISYTSAIAGRLCLLVAAFGIFTLLITDPQLATAQTRSRRVEFTLAVEPPDALSSDIPEKTRHLRDREMAQMVADRIKTRLHAIDVKHSRVQIDDAHQIQVTIFGRDLSETALKSSLIPPGTLEIRAVLTDPAPWIDLESELPEGVEIQTEPGAFHTDRLFLFSEDPSLLHQLLSRVTFGQTEVAIFPHNDGWRTVLMGPPLGTNHDILRTTLSQTPSAIPFVTTRLTSDATAQIRARAASVNASHLAVLLDGELVAMPRFSERQFTDELVLDCPSFLRSIESRSQWAMQVAGRLAAPIPITLTEIQE